MWYLFTIASIVEVQTRRMNGYARAVAANAGSRSWLHSALADAFLTFITASKRVVDSGDVLAFVSGRLFAGS
jgi:hypothetical protein